MGVAHLKEVPLAENFRFPYLTPDYGTERRLSLK